MNELIQFDSNIKLYNQFDNYIKQFDTFDKIEFGDDICYYLSKDKSIMIYFSNVKIYIAKKFDKSNEKNSYRIYLAKPGFAKLKNVVDKYNK